MSDDPQALHDQLQRWLDDWERDVPQPEPMLAAMRAVVESLGRKLAEGSHYTTVESCDEDDVIYAQELLGVIATALGVWSG